MALLSPTQVLSIWPLAPWHGKGRVVSITISPALHCGVGTLLGRLGSQAYPHARHNWSGLPDGHAIANPIYCLLSTIPEKIKCNFIVRRLRLCEPSIHSHSHYTPIQFYWWMIDSFISACMMHVIMLLGKQIVTLHCAFPGWAMSTVSEGSTLCLSHRCSPVFPHMVWTQRCFPTIPSIEQFWNASCTGDRQTCPGSFMCSVCFLSEILSQNTPFWRVYRLLREVGP